MSYVVLVTLSAEQFSFSVVAVSHSRRFPHFSISKGLVEADLGNCLTSIRSVMYFNITSEEADPPGLRRHIKKGDSRAIFRAGEGRMDYRQFTKDM